MKNKIIQLISIICLTSSLVLLIIYWQNPLAFQIIYPTQKNTTIPKITTLATVSAPTWNQLTEDQKEILSAFTPETFDKLPSVKREKWRIIANKILQQPTASQEKFKLNNQLWLSLSPEEREKIRQTQLTINQKKIDTPKLWSQFQETDIIDNKNH